MNMKYYTYLLLDPMNEYLPFYVGKGNGNRAYVHDRNHSIRDDKNFLRRKILKNLQNNGLTSEVYFWKEKLTEEQAFDLEVKLIKMFGRRIDETGILTNLTEGGEGFSGFDLSESNRKRWQNPAIRLKIIKNMKKAQTKETRERKSIAVTKIWADEEYRKNRIDKIHGELIQEEKICETCNNPFMVEYRTNPSKRKTEQMNRRFCNRSCSSKHNVKIMEMKNAEQK